MKGALKFFSPCVFGAKTRHRGSVWPTVNTLLGISRKTTPKDSCLPAMVAPAFRPKIIKKSVDSGSCRKSGATYRLEISPVKDCPSSISPMNGPCTFGCNISVTPSGRTLILGFSLFRSSRVFLGAFPT